MAENEERTRRSRRQQKKRERNMEILKRAGIGVLILAVLLLVFSLILAKQSGGKDAGSDAAGDGTESAAAVTYTADSPDTVRGLYITGEIAGGSRLDTIWELTDSTSLNTVIVDVKDESGITASEMYDVSAFISAAKAHGVRTIARICCFKDTQLASEQEEYALIHSNGVPAEDGNGNRWVNPYNSEVWAYIADRASEAAKAGFDAVVFDDARFPELDANYPVDFGADADTGYEAGMEAFASYIDGRMKEEGITYGYICAVGSVTEENYASSTGQDPGDLASYADFICPQIFPSEITDSANSKETYDSHPYDGVKTALDALSAKVAGGSKAEVYPTLQSFTAGWVSDNITYDGAVIREEIDAAEDSGYSQWILWNVSGNYPVREILQKED